MKVPLELLSSQERSLRPPLQTLLARVNRRLDEIGVPSAVSDNDVYALLQCYNLCALVEAMAGRADEARRLCLDGLRWIGRVADSTGRTGVLSYAFQPWVNLARLDRIAGDLASARVRLDVLRAASQGHAVALGPIALEADQIPILIAHVPGLTSFLHYNWIHERLLCELRSDALEGRREVEAVANARQSILFNGMALEANLIARRQARDDAEAEGSCPYPEVVNAFPVNVVMSIRRAEIAVKQRRHAPDEINAEALEKIGLHLLVGEPSPWHLAVVQPIVHLLCELKPGADVNLASAAYEAARRLGDEILQAWFASACAEHDEADPIWQARLRDLASRTWYASIGSHAGGGLRSTTRLDDVHHRLIECAQRMFSTPVPASAGVSVPPLDAPMPLLLNDIQSATDKAGEAATAKLHFSRRSLHPLVPLFDDATPAWLRTMIGALDFASQSSFAGKRYREALALSGPVARYVLTRTEELLRLVFGPCYDEDLIRVCVRVDEKSSYRQMQGPHIDWTKGAAFDERMFGDHDGGTHQSEGFAALRRCYSVDCVIGGPQTDYFLEECTALCHLIKADSGAWIIDAIDFDLQQAAQPAPAGCFLLRLPYTIHQFPGTERWTTGNPRRLFVSCDYHRA